ncbi:hypothetical protein ACSD7O_14320 [Methylorubrum extorquens]|uniref:hypothetical protein n=1 Tax=Methylorubrum extorquens TaxID=408 RepID=UPI003F623AC0
MEVKNGTTVHRVWSGTEEAELLAVFQYVQGAQTYCRAAIEREPDGCFLIWVDHYSGKMNIVQKPSLAPTVSPEHQP